MNYSKTLRIFFVYVLLFFSVFYCIGYLSGCSRQPAKSPPKKQESKKKESKALKELQKDIESLVKEFEKEYLKQTAPPPQPPAQQGQQEKQGQQQGPQQDQGQQQNQQDGKQAGQQDRQNEGQAQQGGGKSQQEGPNWPEFEKAVTKLHTQWNGFQGEATKNGATSEMVDNFSVKLNELTVNLTRQDLYRGLLAANDLYVETIPFERLFQTKAPPDIKKVLYYSRDATYKALHDEQGQALESVSSAEKVWQSVKPQLEDMDISNKVEYALKELREGITQKDPNLIKIEAQILEKNIQEAIEAMGQKS
jgi:hypothetical protein